MDKSVSPVSSGFTLFVSSETDHFLIAAVTVFAGPRATGPVGTDDTTKGGLGLLIAMTDPVVGHKLEVIGMGTDAEMGTALFRCGWIGSIRDVEFRLHRAVCGVI